MRARSGGITDRGVLAGEFVLLAEVSVYCLWLVQTERLWIFQPYLSHLVDR